MFVSKRKYNAIYEVLQDSISTEFDLLEQIARLNRDYNELEDLYFEKLNEISRLKKPAKKVAKKTTKKKEGK